MKRALAWAFAAVAAALAPVCAVAAEAPLPGVPSVEEIMHGLRSDVRSEVLLARGWLRFLDDSQLQAVLVDFDKHGSLRDNGPVLEQVRLGRGDPALLKEWTSLVLRNEGSLAFPLSEMSPRDLEPLAVAVAAELEAMLRRGERTTSRLWLDLAARAGNPPLVRAALAAAATGDGRISLRLAADVVAAALPAPAGDADHLRILLGSLAPGWSEGPPPTYAALASSPDARVRAALARTLAQSTSAKAAELAQNLLRDPDPDVRREAQSAFVQLRPNPPPAPLRALAADGAAEAQARAWAWRELAAARDPALITEAKSLMGHKTSVAPLREAAIGYLARLGEGPWLLDQAAALGPELLGHALAELAVGADGKVVAAAAKYLDSARPEQVGAVVSAFARGNAAALLLVIERLKDAQGGTTEIAEQALEAATGLVGPHATVPERGGKAAKAVDAYAVWKAWFDRFRAPLDDVRADTFERERALVSAGDDTAVARADEPAWALARLCSDRAYERAALARLARHPDPEVTTLLIALIDDPQFCRRQDELARALARRVHPAAAVSAITARLAGPDPGLAVRVLAAWRADSAAGQVVEKAIAGWAFDEAREDLVAWAHPAIAAAARAHASDQESGASRRAQVLMAALATPADVKALAALLRKDSGADAALSGLIQLAVRGVASAQDALAAVLTAKDPALARRVLDAAVSACQAGDDLEAPERLVKSACALPLVSGDGDLARSAFALLARSGDVSALDAFRARCTRADAEWLRGMTQSFPRTGGDRAVPYAQTLLNAPALDEQEAQALVAWLAKRGALESKDAERILAERKRRAAAAFDAALGRPAEGLMFTVDLPKDPIPLRKSTIPLTITVRNVGRRPVGIYTQWEASILMRGGDVLDRGMTSTKTPGVGPNHNVLLIAPGGSVRAILDLGMRESWTPRDLATQARLRISTAAMDDERSDSRVLLFDGAWIPIAFAPPLLDAVDKRYAK